MTEQSGAPARERTSPPEPGPIRAFHFPEVVPGSMDNGLELRVVRMPRLPVVSVSLVLNAGESWLARDRAGLAVLTGDCLEGGTEALPGNELAEALEGIGASLRVSTGWDATTVSLSCHADRLVEALPILAGLIRRPAFPDDEVARVRAQHLASLEERRKQPGKIAADAALGEIFADEVPYARPTAGLPESVEELGTNAVRSFADEAYRPGDGGLVVAGDVGPEELEAMAAEHLGSWSGEGRGRPEFRARPRSDERRIVVVDRPGSVQSEIRMGHVGIRKSSEDYFPILVFNTILGGTFTSRLNQSLREEHGYTYGVRSRFSARREPGPFTISTAVETAVTADAVDEALRQVEALVADGPTEEEVASARDYVVGVFPLRFETTGQVSSRIAELIVYDLPDDFHAAFRDRVRGVEPADVEEAARRRVHPDEMAIVVVGDADEVAGPLEALGLGPVEVVSGP